MLGPRVDFLEMKFDGRALVQHEPIHAIGCEVIDFREQV